MKRALILLPLLFACSGDDQPSDDAGADATTDATTKDAPAADVAKDAPAPDASNDAGTDSAGDAASDAASDVVVLDAPADVAPEAAAGCDGGCTLYSYECKGQQPQCSCVGLAGGQAPPGCDSGTANCFVDPCLTKTVQCVNNQCVVL